MAGGRTLSRMGLARGGGASLAGRLPCALITSKAGSTPPYRYAAAEATMDQDGAWSLVEDGIAYSDVFCLSEQGVGATYLNPLQVGDAVVILGAPDPDVDAWVAIRAQSRGAVSS